MKASKLTRFAAASAAAITRSFRSFLSLRLVPSICFCLIPLLGASTYGQTSETGLPPFGSFQGGKFDLVSLENGNLHIEIPIYTVHQRALPDLTYNFVYDIPGWQMDRTPVTPTTFQWVAAPQPHQLSGWHLLRNEVGPWHVDHEVVGPKVCYRPQDPTQGCPGGVLPVQYNVHTNYALTDTHGTTHPFEVRYVEPDGFNCPCGGDTPSIGNQNTGVALDGSGFTIAIVSNPYDVTIGTPNNYGPLNGNTYTTPGISETNTTDSNGKLVSTTWTYSDSNGNQQQIKVDYTTVLFTTSLCPLLATDGWPCTEGGMSSQLPQKLTLPTGRFYFFTWSTDGNGDLLRLDLPTGGYIAYTYRTYTKFLGITYSGGTDGKGRGIGSPSKHYRARRQVASRTVSDGITANKWSYNGFTITDPLGNDEVHTFSAFGDSSDPPRYETQILYYQGSASSGTLLKTINKDYAFETSAVQADAIDHGDINIRLIRETTILDDGMQSKTETDYEMFQQAADPSIGGFDVTRLNPTETREFDWGSSAPGPSLRRTDYTYLHTGNQNYLSRNIVRQVATTTVYDGNSNQVAQTVNEYDNYSHPGQPMVASNAIQHDPAYDTSFIYRGNVTAVSHWRNTDGAMLTSTNQYDDAGNLLSTIDPLGNKTSYDYTDVWGNGSCTPVGQAKVFATTITNALNQPTTKSYNSCTGTLASVTDPNSQPTTYSYDPVARLASVNRPDGGSTANTYDDAQLVVTSSSRLDCTDAATGPPCRQIISAGSRIFSRRHYDQLGRSVQTELCEDGATACATSIKTDTTYDAIGRVSTVSNPYRTANDPGPTNGTTTTHYDAVGRITQVTFQDGGISTTDYSKFPTVKTTDPAGNERKSRTDALGRLVEVDEPGPGPDWQGTPGQGSITISGSLQSSTTSANATGSVTVSGQVERLWVRVCTDSCVLQRQTDPGGRVSITVNGYVDSVVYRSTDTANSIANNLIWAINNDTGAFAWASGPSCADSTDCTISLQARTPGPNYSLAAQGLSNDLTYSSFEGTSASGPTLTGGAYPVTTYDSGTLTVTISGPSISTFQASASYNQNLNNTPQLMASALVSALNAPGSPMTAGIDPNNASTIDITAVGVGQATDFTVTGGTSASFTASSTTLSNGSNATGIYAPYVTKYSYDGLGNLTQANQIGDGSQAARVRTFTYDSLSRLLTAQNPESGTITYNYDADGNMVQKTSPAPNQTGTATQAISYCYDSLNRVTGKAYSAQTCTNGLLPSGTAAVSYFYDQASYQGLPISNGIGQLTGISDQAGTGAYSFDPTGRIAAEQRTIAAQTKSMGYEYYLDGSLKVLHYPSGAAVTYTPDAAGRMLSAVDNANGANYATGATYGPDGSPTGFVSGNTITNSFSYNKRLQPVSMSASTSSQTVFSIGYDFHLNNGDNGNVYGITNYKDNGRNQTFTYDQLNRLASAQNAGTDCTQNTVNGKTKFWGNSYGYDAWGNLLQKNITKCGPENMDRTADAQNRLHVKVGADYQYDAAGNMTYDAAGLYYSYDQESRITGAGGYTYTYDADGNRVEKSNGSTGTLYWYMSPGIVAESDLNGNLQSEYVFFDGERVARKDFPSNAVSYYFSDHLKTTDIVTDAQGNIKNESDFYPWGGELQFLANDSNHYKFTGKERDAETGLDYFGARYYSNGLGRFIMPDWSATPVPVPYADLGDPQTLNQYSYVRNIPTVRVDADGHDGCCTLPSLEEVEQALREIEAASAEGGAGVSGSATLTGVAIVFVPLMIKPDILPGGTVGQSNEEEKAQIEQARQDRMRQNGGVDPQQTTEPAAASGGARKGGGKAYDDSPKNDARIAQGKPPIGKDGHPMELHSPEQTHQDQSQEMTRTDHRLNGNFKKNHTNTGQQRSKVDRNQAARDRRAHWKKVHEDKNQPK